MLLMLWITLTASANSKTVTLTFNLSDFEFSLQSTGELLISSASQDISFGEDNEPALPKMSYILALPGNYNCSSYSATVNKRQIRTDTKLIANPKTINIDGNPDETIDFDKPYAKKLYPESNCVLSKTDNWKDLTLLHFTTQPFIYDAKTGTLYFVDSMTLSISYEEQINSDSSSIGFAPKDMACIASNFDDSFNSNRSNHTYDLTPLGDVDFFEYLIITSEELKDSFLPLVQWKRIKGIRANIISIEDINNAVSGSSQQLRIKKYLKDRYLNHGLQFVLLGGDDGIIPVFYAYGKTRNSKGLLPADMYYACFTGDLNWNEDGDEYFGELEDNISLSPNIYVTRALVSNQEEVSTFVNKIISYEKSPLWNNTLLMSGVKVSQYSPSGKSDVDVQGHQIYYSSIYPYWNGELTDFYDTTTSFPEGAAYDVTYSHLQTQLSKGYSIIDIYTHGDTDSWRMEEANTIYSSALAKTLSSPNHSIILTAACNTNRFDNPNHSCLSKAFMNNPESGVVAYLGSSREGKGSLFYRYSGPSQKYNQNFYFELFGSQYNDKNFGELAYLAKNQLLSNSKGYDGYRWVALSLNPIGDPEMPIYTDEPKSFPKIMGFSDKSKYYLRTGTEGCQITIISKDDFGESYFKTYRNTQSLNFSLPMDCYVCVTKPNYKPYVEIFDEKHIEFENPQGLAINNVTPNPTASSTKINIKNPNHLSNLSFQISGITTNSNKSVQIPDGEENINLDISELQSGVYVLNLMSGEQLVDSKEIIKK